MKTEKKKTGATPTAAEMRRRASELHQLIRSKAPEARDRILEVVKDGDADPDFRADATYMLGRAFRDESSVLGALIEDADAPPRVREAAIGAAVDNGILDVVDAIRSVAESTSEVDRMRERAISALYELDPDTGRSLLLANLKDRSNSDDVRESLIYRTFPAVDEGVREVLLALLRDKGETRAVRSAAVEQLAEVPDVDVGPLLVLIRDQSEDYDVSRAAVRALGRRDEENTVAILLDLANDPNIDRGIRLDVIASLARHSARPDVRTMVIQAIVNEPGSDVGRSFRVSPDANWRDVLNEFLAALKTSRKRPNEIDAGTIISSIRSSTVDDDFLAIGSSVNADLLGQALIEAAVEADDRMTGILGRLLVQTVDGDQDAAGSQINAYESEHVVSQDVLRKLRYAVGGEEALDPIVRTLKQNLEDFSTPIDELNLRTREAWARTVSNAQTGFEARMWMSGIVFTVGIVLLAISSYQFLAGKLDAGSLYGPGVPFVAGLAMTLLVVYRGPLAEVRQSVNDVGIANASFIAFVHRILETSTTFSYFYLEKKMDFEELRKANGLIKEALLDTVTALRLEAIDSSANEFSNVIDRVSKTSGSTETDGPTNGED